MLSENHSSENRQPPDERAPAVTDFTLGEFEEWVGQFEQPAYRARQVFEWVYQHGAVDFSSMTNLPRPFRERLAGNVQLFSSAVSHQQASRDGTLKFLIRLQDGELIETVMIPEPRRITVCVSSQAGCGMGCVFCASGLLGLRRNLSCGEIVEQILHVRRALPPGARVSNLVFMGMGEPLGNYENLDRAIQILHADWGCGIGKRHLTVSTVGLLENARKLSKDHPQVTLAVSLHAPNDEVRQKIVPTARNISVDDLIAGARDYFGQTGRKLTFEYCLIRGLNSEPAHARELANRLRGLTCYVNLIPLNPVTEIPFNPPSLAEVRVFADILERAGVQVAIRRQRGDDIDAACGQLKLKDSDPGERVSVAT